MKTAKYNIYGRQTANHTMKAGKKKYENSLGEMFCKIDISLLHIEFGQEIGFLFVFFCEQKKKIFPTLQTILIES